MVYIRGGDTYPAYNFDETEPLAFSDVVSERHGLPLLRRSMAEIDEDISLEMRAEEAHERSVTRRGPERYESRFVVEYLDELDDTLMRIGKMITGMMMQRIQIINSEVENT